MRKRLIPSANGETTFRRSRHSTTTPAKDGTVTSESVSRRMDQGGLKKAHAPLVGGRPSLVKNRPQILYIGRRAKTYSSEITHSERRITVKTHRGDDDNLKAEPTGRGNETTARI